MKSDAAGNESRVNMGDAFVFPASLVPNQGTQVFLQMVIEEGTVSGDAEFTPYQPRRVAASRGTWFGVAKP